ncbi:hypothetical protein V1264_017555 [Littorina saxatilis]|uniref:Uncharacterized protein n=1 Tax=Littorina saxatilis TaxID=31220 RepID=A0AAN9BHD5_9CAEN
MEEDETMSDDIFATETQKMLPLLETKRSEFVADMHFDKNLSDEKAKEARDISMEFEKNLTDVPMTTNLLGCNIEVTEKRPVFIKPRPIPHAMVGTVEDEISEMLMRWAIQLQPHSFTVKVIPGKDNHGADYMSRASY